MIPDATCKQCGGSAWRKPAAGKYGGRGASGGWLVESYGRAVAEKKAAAVKTVADTMQQWEFWLKTNIPATLKSQPEWEGKE